MTRTQKAQQAVVSLLDAYRHMDMPLRKYLVIYLGGSMVLSALCLLYALFMDPPTMLRLPLLGGAVFAPATALVYPRVLLARQANALDEQFHLFVTHLTVMSLTNTNRVGLFRALAEEDEYGEISTEMGRLIGLIDTWNMSLDDACRQRSKQVPSDLMADFYERLAYNVGAGQQISDFLTSEHEAIIQDFATEYRANLDRMETFGELYISIVLSGVFAVMFGVIVPFITGADPLVVIGGIILVFIAIEILFVFLIDLLSPADPLWFQPSGIVVQRNRTILVLLALAGVAVLGLTGVVVLAWLGFPLLPDFIPTTLYPAIPTTPLLIPGLYIYHVEGKIKNADSHFPSFIRGLGAIESVKQSSTASVLRLLRRKDFGVLNPFIDALYRRLNVRVNTKEAWRYFSAEIGSYLIQNFSDMYVQARSMGGDPSTLGKIISQNMSEVLKLREHRKQVVSTMTGQLYGINIAASFSFFVGIEIIKVLLNITEEVDIDQAAIGQILNAGVYDIEVLTILIFGAVMANAMITAIIIQRSNRRYFWGTTLHFTLLMWLGYSTGLVVEYMASNYLTLS